MKKIIEEHKRLKIGACFGAVICILFMFFSIYFTPNFVADNLSTDGILEQITIFNINFIRLGLIILSTIGLLISALCIIKPNLFYLLQLKISYHISKYKTKHLKYFSFYFYVIISINLFLLVYTFFLPEIRATHRYFSFNLGVENNFAVWWSGMLFFLAGLHAFDGYVLLKSSAQKAANGWASLSIILMILSLDEIGSFHERVGDLFQLSILPSTLPFAIILLALLIYALFSLRTAKDEVKKTWLIIIAFCIFGSVAFQEWLEFHVDWPPELKRLRLVVEEGSELLGITILLKVCMSNSQRLFDRKNSRTAPILDAIYFFRNHILVTGVVLAPVVAYITAVLPDQHRGHPADWFAAMYFFLAAGAGFKQFLEDNETFDWYHWSITIMCLCASGISVGFPSISTVRYISFYAVTWNSWKLLVLFTLIFIMHVIWLLKFELYMRLRVLFFSVSVVGGFALFSFFKTNLFIVYGMSQYLGLMTYYVNSSRNR